MTDIDPGFRNAINIAVKNSNQGDGVASRLDRWFEELLDGTERIEKLDSVYKRLELIYDAIDITLPPEN
jgi:hypothetical protein